MEAYPIPGELLTKIMNYLAQRPWIEVNGMIQGVEAALAAATAPPPTQSESKE